MLFVGCRTSVVGGKPLPLGTTGTGMGMWVVAMTTEELEMGIDTMGVDIMAAVVVTLAMTGMKDVVLACVDVGRVVGTSTWPSLAWLAAVVAVCAFVVGVEGLEEEDVGGWTTSLEMPNWFEYWNVPFCAPLVTMMRRP